MGFPFNGILSVTSELRFEGPFPSALAHTHKISSFSPFKGHDKHTTTQKYSRTIRTRIVLQLYKLNLCSHRDKVIMTPFLEGSSPIVLNLKSS